MVAYVSSPGIEGYPLVGAAAPWGEGPGVFKVGFDFDWAAIAKARADRGLTPLAALDTIVIGQMPVGALLIASSANVVVPSTVAATISLGIAGTAGLFATAVATGTAGFTVHAVAPVGTLTTPKDIILTLTTVPLTGKTRVTALVANML